MRRVGLLTRSMFNVRQGCHTERNMSKRRPQLIAHVRMVVIVATPQKSVRNAKRWDENARQKALVVIAFIELVNAVDAAHSGQVAKCDFVGSNADDGAVFLE